MTPAAQHPARFGDDDPESIKHKVRIIGNVEVAKDYLAVCVCECSCGLVFAEDPDVCPEEMPPCPSCDPEGAALLNRWARPGFDAPWWDSRRRMYDR